MHVQPTTRRRSGLSLIEVIVSTLLVGLVIVASLKTAGAVFRTWQVTENKYDGTALAMELMTEVLQARYEEPIDTPAYGVEGAEVTNSRAAWDDTDDYDDWTASPPQAKDGTALSGYTGWTRSVIVQKVNAGAPGTVRIDNAVDKGLRKITVTLTDPQGQQTILVGLRARDGAMEKKSPTQSPNYYVTWVGSKLQVGSSAAAIASGTNITNHATDQ
jgi:Tfp pilus assembly protein PilV